MVVLWHEGSSVQQTLCAPTHPSNDPSSSLSTQPSFIQPKSLSEPPAILQDNPNSLLCALFCWICLASASPVGGLGDGDPQQVADVGQQALAATATLRTHMSMHSPRVQAT